MILTVMIYNYKLVVHFSSLSSRGTRWYNGRDTIKAMDMFYLLTDL